MAVSQILSVRGFQLASILDKKHGELELVLKIMDLENGITEARNEAASLREELHRFSGEELLPNSVEIEEFADEDGHFTSPPDEHAWIDSLCDKTGLDVRAILSPLPEEVGLYSFRIAYKQNGEMAYALQRVWIISAKN